MLKVLILLVILCQITEYRAASHRKVNSYRRHSFRRNVKLDELYPGTAEDEIQDASNMLGTSEGEHVGNNAYENEEVDSHHEGENNEYSDHEGGKIEAYYYEEQKNESSFYKTDKDKTEKEKKEANDYNEGKRKAAAEKKESDDKEDEDTVEEKESDDNKGEDKKNDADDKGSKDAAEEKDSDDKGDEDAAEGDKNETSDNEGETSETSDNEEDKEDVKIIQSVPEGERNKTINHEDGMGKIEDHNGTNELPCVYSKLSMNGREMHKFVVALLNVSDDKHFCNGLILSAKHVLTVASCLCDLGEQKDANGILIKTDPTIKDSQTYKVRLTVCHPDYNNKTKEIHNIGILAITTSFDYSKRVRKYTIDFYYNRVTAKLARFEVIAPTWGENHRVCRLVNYLHILFLHKSVCEFVAYSAMSKAHQIRQLNKWDICSIQSRGSTCYQGPGSPVIRENHVVGMLTGATCPTGLRSVYTIIDVPYHYPWIITASKDIFKTIEMTPSDWPY